MKYGRRRDANERAVIAALELAGAAVAQIDTPGAPDLLVEYRGVLRLVEVKEVKVDQGKTKVHKGKHSHPDPAFRELTPAQVEWWSSWSGTRPIVVHDPDEALASIGATPDASLSPSLVPDAIAVHLQRKPRIGGR